MMCQDIVEARNKVVAEAEPACVVLRQLCLKFFAQADHEKITSAGGVCSRLQVVLVTDCFGSCSLG